MSELKTKLMREYHELVSSNRIQTCALCVEKNLYIMEIWKGKIYASFGTLDIKYQFFIRIDPFEFR